ncbi:putative 2,4-dienoyl-coa reductase-like protein [Trypanosoma grayi]|uniref:putative 2,4-dienoyl-coa reductase-like protein n=1 Tax=Trypanosoma grayi TaxID=71804 RepID=UPI0004F496B0|nr:putative 2,4-dienoyl-coa reductase-like protein [Trypanosoma grayi]KEG12613.1 putative 2,4-dienoyl-coa reductase-like protein [Trypanosoma grayi]
MAGKASPLFSPICIGGAKRRLQLPNRFLMLPMYLNMEQELLLWTDDHMDALGSFYAERARHGAKLIVCGGLGVSRLGKWRIDSMALGTHDAAKALSRVTHAVHQEGGTILAQALHPGRAARRRWFISSTSTPSSVQPFPKAHPWRLPGPLVDYIVSEHARFARLAEEAGFDGIEIPVSEGGLLHNFLSTAVNNRRDRFGGSLEGRLEATLRVLEAVRQALAEPERFLVSVRLCVHDLKVGGTPLAETIAVAEALARFGGVDLLSTSVGMHDSPVQTLASGVPQAAFARCVRAVREHLHSHSLCDIPVVATHRVHSIAVAERLLREGVCDMVGVARPLLADPQMIRKAEEGHTDAIVPCIACNHCINRLYKHQRITCALNPICGYERERKWAPAKYKKSIAVVGAGAAGVTCALTLWRRGHDVTLFEKSGCIGGQLNLAKVVPGKETYQDVLEYWTRQLRQSTINVRLGAEFTREEMARNHQFFHAVVLCCGSLPRPATSHQIPGTSECPLVVPFEKILNGSVRAGRRVVIIGNGAISHDVASYLLHDPRVSRSIEEYCGEWGVNLDDGSLDPHAAERAPRNNRDIVLFNKADKDADLSRGKGWSQKLWIRNHGGTIIKHGLVENIDKKGVHISMVAPDSRKYFVECDTIVWAYGMLPNISVGTWIYEWMKDGARQRGEMIADFSIYTAGSCRDSYTGEGHGEQDLLQAVHEGYEIGYKI